MATIRERLHADLRAAMTARDAVRTSVLRTALSAVANAEAVDPAEHGGATEVARRDLSEDDIRAVIAAERDDLETVASELLAHGREGDAEVLVAKAAVLAAHLDHPR